MEESRKPRRWARWLVVGPLLLVAYPASAGPAEWYFSRNEPSESVAYMLDAFYTPLLLMLRNSQEPVKVAFESYLNFWQEL